MTTAAVTRNGLRAGLVAVACLAGAGCDDGALPCAENLHRIGLALHAFHDDRGAFPKAAISDKQGRPGLSWRVAILPYLGETELYEKFNLDEAWDGPHNRALLGAMPAVYACPGTTRRDSSLTTYRGFNGPDAFFL